MFTVTLVPGCQNSRGRQGTSLFGEPVKGAVDGRGRSDGDGVLGCLPVGDRFIEVDRQRHAHTDRLTVERIDRWVGQCPWPDGTEGGGVAHRSVVITDRVRANGVSLAVIQRFSGLPTRAI